MMEAAQHNQSTSQKPVSINSTASTGGAASSEIRMPRVIQERTDQMAERIAQVDIGKINRYLSIANLAGAAILCIASFVAFTRLHNYNEFLIYSTIIILSIVLVLVENHEQFPQLSERIKKNFGFLFTAMGRAFYLLIVAILAFSLGWFGCFIGLIFVVLSLFNFFLIFRHPAYQAHMTAMETPADNVPAVPEVRYNPNQSSTTNSSTHGHIMV